MDRLLNKTILIGKDPDSGRLLVSVNVDGKQLSGLTGQPGSVPGSVSRCRPTDNTGHCKIEVDENGKMMLTNLKPQNVTTVNGKGIEVKRIQPTDTVTLGIDKYPLDINSILTAACQIVDKATQKAPGPKPPQKPKETHSISHLEDVWKEYEDRMESIQRKQQKIGKRRMIPMILGPVGGVVTTLVAMSFGASMIISLLPGVLIAGVGFINYNTKDTSIEDKKEATNYLYDNYVCPDCKHFLGMQPYKIMRQNKKCPYCGCGFKED